MSRWLEGVAAGRARKLRPLLAVSLAVGVAFALPSLGFGAAPVVHVHDNFTSDSYPDNWCGIDGTSIDTVVAQYKENASGAAIENVNVKTVFTATASGKSMVIHSTGVRKRDAAVDNGDGTVTIVAQVRGASPQFKLPNGPVIVMDVGSLTFSITLDAATGDFISFEVLREKGQHPPGCDAIIAALS